MTSADRPADLDQALGAAIELLRSEQLPEAEGALDALLACWPDQPDALHFLGVLRHTQGRSDEAVALVRQSLAQVPGNVGAWNNLGNILLLAQRFDEAADAYEHSVEAAHGTPAASQALDNLAVLYRKQGRALDAERVSRQAIALNPDDGDAWYRLSQALLDQGQVREGLLANSRAIALWPRHQQARSDVLRALVLLGERQRAVGLYREWLAEEPDNPIVQHLLAASSGETTPERASDAYVEQVFDSFAASFDAKLESLHYRAPALVAQALQRAVGAPAAELHIADLGCGTGLCGPLLRPFARQLAGCDLSVGMLRQAQARHAYDQLHKAELGYYLRTQPDHFDVLVSADTLIYFGDLHAVMRDAAVALHAGGWFIFTVEALPDAAGAPVQLLPNGRYAHHRNHVESALAAAGLTLEAIEAETLRTEGGKGVAGWLVSARKQHG
ncbi:tetratricopeptide repeat protein [Aquincola sp. S2]|uniref:Tetratricopeptide repeat protein n=1 Tax=Pseudaquabacterium terrae TaxID=2732868 RepID=A0ABX2EC05_9BURK|nr:tetratricopeptide repeat protein [Aquabacterium terrae]NRF66458.1 tetratricopeptide repeat protein [Aquabacterium terrae]